MRNLFCLLLSALISFSAFAQRKGTLKDSKTKEPIPYVNISVERNTYGTTADENGNFTLAVTDDSKNIIFSAVGYTKKSLNAGGISGTIYLDPQAIQLNEVVIENKKNTSEITIGSLKNAENNYFLASGARPWMFANFFEYKPEYATAPYLKTVKIIADADHKGASFNVRLYSVNENGEPGEFLHDENIICYPKKGTGTQTIDLSKLNIRFPEKGFFIALEWLIIEQNHYESVERITFDTNGNKIELKPKDYIKVDYYTPAFATTGTDKDIITWVYTNGKWSEKNPAMRLAMELILTN